MISLIAALSSNHVIGNHGELPWRLAEDWRHFKEVTSGSPMIMGRTSAMASDALFSDTKNVILTSRSSINLDREHWIAHSLDQALDLLRSYPRIFIIGGEQVFRQSMDLADDMVLTHVDATVVGDAFFPTFSTEDWDQQLLFRQEADASNSHPFSIIHWTRKAMG